MAETTVECANPDCPELGIPKAVPEGTALPIMCGGFGPGGFYCGAVLVEAEDAPPVPEAKPA